MDEEGSNKTDEEPFTPQEVFTEEEKSFIVYPNPAREEVNILFKGYEEGETVMSAARTEH